MADAGRVRHGRRTGTATAGLASSLESLGPGPSTMQRPPEFTLPLKPGTKPDEVDGTKLHKAVESEYITKYLERIGAAPTKANMEYVRKQAPLARENVKAKLKVKGHFQDEVALTAPEVQPEFVMPTGVPSQAMVLMGMMNNVEGVPEGEDEAVLREWGTHVKSGARNVVVERGEEPRFEDMTAKFVYPYNLKLEGVQFIREHARAKLAAQQASLDAKAGSSAHKATQSGRDKSARAQAGSRGAAAAGSSAPAFGRRQGVSAGSARGRATGTGDGGEEEPAAASSGLQDEHSGKMVSLEDLEAEMAGEFEITPEVVLALQSDFENGLLEWREGMSAKALGRVSEADFRATVEALSSDLVLHLFGTAIAYMYDEYINPSRRSELTDAEEADFARIQQERVFNMHRQWATITKAYRSSRSRLFFTLPVLLLSMRTCVECLFREVFPLWSSINEGLRAMRGMQATITDLFDPHGYYSNLSILQSAPAAMRIIDSYKRLAHTHVRHHFNDTSALVRAAFVDSRSVQARRMLYAQASKPTPARATATTGDAELEPEQRQKLVELAKVVHADTRDLRQVGRHQVADRAGWLSRKHPWRENWSK
eukprot:jgi/Tetstr1/437430/TSEL_026111.t1